MAAIEFRLLGPLEVRRGERPVAVHGSRSRALLAMLLLNAREVVSSDRLIDALWGEWPPRNAVNALQARVAALRRVLDPDRPSGSLAGSLITRPPGYVLQIDRDALDITRFEELVAEGRHALPVDPAAAIVLLRDALALWRGPALADVASETFATAHAARLEELRLVAIQARIDAELTLGAHAEAVPELEALLAEHPLHEAFASRLMVALYRCARQADASRVFHSTRAALIDQLGMEPGPPLRQLLQRVLDQDPSLDWSPPDPASTRPAPPAPERSHRSPPAELTSFIGREHELEKVRTLLQSARLLTLTGPGGAGKTRLAIRVTTMAARDIRDGLVLVELGALADPGLVAGALAAALGMRERSGPLLEALKGWLADQQVLVVLDNCEHVIDACAELASELLTGCTGVQILATSREPLKLSSEVTWPVPGLAMPGVRPLPPTEELNRYDAVRLFVERAAAVRAGFALDPGNAGSVAQICVHLDGIPLAIELAAARVRALSPAEILQRLDDRLGLLTHGARDLAPRHRTLRNTIDWSHELLDRDERALFRRLAVFAGGWDLTDAHRVCADDTLASAAIVDVLSELVAKSLVIAEPRGPAATRYRMLEMLRDYACERLTTAGEHAEFASRHLSHFLDVAQAAREQQPSGGSLGGLQTLAAQQDNIRAALAFARSADPAACLRLATASEELWVAGPIAEGSRWLEEALAHAPRPTRARVRALNCAARLTTLLEAYNRAADNARQLVHESLALASTLGDEAGEASARLQLGFLELACDHPAAAIPHLEQSRDMHQRLDDRHGLSRSLLFLGLAKRLVPIGGEPSRIELESGLEIAQAVGDAWGIAFGQIYVAFADLDAGDDERAAIGFHRGLAGEALGPIRAAALEGLAELALPHDPRRCIKLQAAATAIRDRDGALPPAWRERRSQTIRAQATQRLGPATAQEVWEEARAMTTEQAITYALAHQPPGTSESASRGTGLPPPPSQAAASEVPIAAEHGASSGFAIECGSQSPC